MAPANGKAPAKGAGRAGVPLPKPVPALPLSYFRHAKSVAPKQQPLQRTQNPEKPVPSTATAATTQPETSSEDTSTPKATPKEPELVQSKIEALTANGLSNSEALSTQEAANGHANETTSISVDLQTAESSSVASSDRTSPNPDRPTATPSQSESSNANSSDEMTASDTLTSGATSVSAHQTSLQAQSMPSHMRFTGYRMPAPFHPSAAHDMHDRAVGHPPPIPGNPIPPSHHAQTSNGNVQFGGFDESNKSSPAPNSASFVLPPAPPLSVGMPPFMSHGPAASSDMPTTSMPFGAEFKPPASTDPFRRPMVGIHNPESYPPYMTMYGPPTPHSFHDSQSSVHADDGITFGQYSPVPLANGQVQAHVRTRSTAMVGMPPPVQMMPSLPPPPNMVQALPDPDAHMFFHGMREYFQDTQFSDCTLEMRFNDGTGVRVPAHRLVLSQSEPLRKLLAQQQPNTAVSSTSIVLNITDAYARSDAVVMALQRLYGYPLFAIPTPPSGSDELQLAGSLVERYSFILGYAACGHALGSKSVVIRGMEVAAQLVSWETLEMALEFALGPTDARGTVDVQDQYPYGEPTRILMNAIVSFIVNHLPLDFSIDTLVHEPKGYSRLPFVPGTIKRSAASNATMPGSPKRNRPQIARGTSVHLKGGRPRSRGSGITGIKFGDLSLEDGAESATPHTNQSRPPHHVLLSRVLLNLPFRSLKAVLEAGGINGPQNDADEARWRLANGIVAEREARRLAAVNGVKAGSTDEFRPARQSLSLMEPRPTDKWAMLGFCEFVQRYANSNAPYLVQAWTPMACRDKSSPLTSPTTMAYP